MLNYLWKYLSILTSLDCIILLPVFILLFAKGLNLPVSKQKDNRKCDWSLNDFLYIYYSSRFLFYIITILILVIVYNRYHKKPTNKTPPAIEKQSNEMLPSVKEQGEAILKRNLNISVLKGMCICEYASDKKYDFGF